MKEKELDKLIQKYLDGRATPKEIAHLEKSEKNSESRILKNIFKSKEEENTIRELMFDKIKEGIKLKYSWWKYASAAAIFVGVVSSGYFFLENQKSDASIIMPSDAITVELEDGSFEILNKDGSIEVIDKNGKVLGRQIGGQISYEEANLTEELVYNTLNVPYGKRFDLKLSDGTMVHLNAGTSLKYPVKFLNGQNRKVFLTGEAFFDVSKDSLHPFVVNADELNVRVLGTRFNVSSYPEDGKTDVVLVEGSVGMHEKIENFDKNTSTILKPGFKGVFSKTSGKIETQAVVTDIYTSWIGGELVFRNMTFKNIIKKLERHYDVSITNNNLGFADEVFNASYGQISLQRLFEELKLTHGIDYTIEGTNITIN